MTPLAFYAPLKPPDHPTPSGDRALARAVMAALNDAGFAPHLAFRLRSLDLSGDTAFQTDVIAQADAALPGIITRGRAAGWALWVTYHNYYKAPDLIGPQVAQALGVPYVQIESTRARKRLTGPWARFAQAAEAAADHADVIFHLTERDGEALHAYAPKGQTILHLPPFLDRQELPAQGDRSGALLTVAMMRLGDKLESYALLADALRRLSPPWSLRIAGDGPARTQVEACFAPLSGHVTWLGALDADGLAREYTTARALLWPGVNEAIGLVYLEAQAAGVSVVAQDRPGLRDVLAPVSVAPVPEAGAEGFARAICETLAAPPDPRFLRQFVAERHLRPVAARRLKAALQPLVKGKS